MTYRNRDLEALGVSASVLEVRAFRRRLGVTQREFAAMAGVHHTTIRNFELGLGAPRATAKIMALVERWKLKPPVLEKKVETRGGWNRGMTG